jgi:phthiocerol/phenolphthiocerol synthesis type-I polyketide synthase E
MSSGEQLGLFSETDIAIIGMSGRFPGARTLDDFWRNLRDGIESISFFSDEELQASGIPSFLSQNPNYVPARAILDDVELFDAAFFGFSPREAALMDPQHRLFLEAAWEALESAGYDPETYEGVIGVYAGASTNSYLFGVYSYAELINAINDFQTIISNDKDFLTTRISYHLNLRGPSVNVQTACSTSLVAIHLACQSLLTGECDMALAGGVSIKIPQTSGYIFQKGAILSADGHCRAFDIRADGTVSGNGVGVVVLKRLSNALADGDAIHAVIKGSAVNNDGSLKVGFTAPSVQGQAAAIAEALLMAGFAPEEISYVEAHGTGTPLGDPIEIAALSEVFRASTEQRGFCAIGSVKTNIGHLDAAAGIAGLIKTVLALKHRQLPPSLHFERPNPTIDFQSSPFFVNHTLSAWDTNGLPRRAGVSSFGIGGTNAHVVLEEAPAIAADEEAQPWHLFVLSARTRSALDAATTNLATFLQHRPEHNLADITYTLQVGRTAFNHRRMLICRDRDDALLALQSHDPERVMTRFEEIRDRPVAFMFPGQATQYVNMGLALYEGEPTFRTQIDDCAEALRPDIGIDLRDILYPGPDRAAAAQRQLEETAIAQPAIFVIEYALARLWMEWGIRPQMMIGHSLGEYVAACLAGVLSLQEGLALVAARGRLMQRLPSGAMLSVALPEEELRPLLGKGISLAAINGASLCVVSGPNEAIATLEADLTRKDVACRPLRTRHAFHSAMMDPILEAFTLEATKPALKPPQIPFISGVSGTWIRAEEATSPAYWTRQLRQPIRFAPGVEELSREPDALLLEVGPGQTLTTLARQQLGGGSARIVLSSLGRPHDRRSELECMLSTLGQLWLTGAKADWAGFHRHKRRRRIPLPTYPFERRRCWVESHNQPQGEPIERGSAEASAFVPAQPRPSLASSYVAPSTELEQRLAEIWQQLLGIEQVGLYDNFFDLGGHSLLATQLVARVRDTFEVDMPLQEVFQAMNIAELATVIERQMLDEIETMTEEEAQRLLGDQIRS